jgi:hypothetical protein
VWANINSGVQLAHKVSKTRLKGGATKTHQIFHNMDEISDRKNSTVRQLKRYVDQDVSSVGAALGGRIEIQPLQPVKGDNLVVGSWALVEAGNATGQ